ncbi:uncharacterized protein LOC130238073 [Danio aesculapii]|uniref:uncharacterized protein LOC130238073 n=1 Tax=Danio aesculapii TaxID=1142201 RepID=UPI0024C07D12|nr:uncharacterized protein LOC130238073 [Danio aesculapii]
MFNDMAVWNEAVENELINLILERPSLYDITENQYANRVAKAELWREIESKLAISDKELKKRWESLRTQYSRYKKLPPSGSLGVQRTGRQQWILNRLQFLDPHTKKRENTSSIKKESSVNSESGPSSDCNVTCSWTTDESSFLEEPSPRPFSGHLSTSRHRLKRSRKTLDDSSSEESSNLMRTIGKTLEKLASQESQNDAISAYCRSLEHRMRSLPPNLLPHFQHEVDNCIFKYLVGESQGQQ